MEGGTEVERDETTAENAARTTVGRRLRNHVLRSRRAGSVSGNERINTLNDGVFAIVITLLAFELKVPQVADQELGLALRTMIPTLLAYSITFVVLGIYWVGQHNMFLHIKRHDRTFMWLDILFLLIVAAMPFPAGLLIQYGDQQLAVVIYAATLAAVGLVLDLLWWYASHDRRLVEHDIDPELVAFVHRRVLMAPVIYLAAIAASFFSLTLAKVFFVVVAVLYILPNPLDHYHHSQVARQEVLSE